MDSHPTYEELKLIKKYKVEVEAINSHPTYEELKQIKNSDKKIKSYKIHILPMRN